MGSRLESLDGQAVISLDRPLTLVGRHETCDLRLDSPRISRRHCCLAPSGGGFEVRDLGSTNGTRINGRRIEKGQLRPGDELAIAHYRYRLTVGPHEPAQTPAIMPDPSSEATSEASTTSNSRPNETLLGTFEADVKDIAEGAGTGSHKTGSHRPG
jgi:pSer/pThr/pTyr-binding forkhead associated (FHA) protein